MMKRSILLASIAPALLLGGCMGTQNRGVESVHQPIVTRQDYAMDLATANGRLALGERQRLAGWLGTMRLGYGDRVAIDDPAGQGGGVREDVAGVVANYGILLSDDAPVTAAPVAAHAVRVVVSRSRAEVPGCPDWSRDAAHEYDNNMSSNYGCAVNGNLAAMIAQPEDLVHGRSGAGTIDPATSTKAIESYRKASPTGNGNTVKAESAKGAN